MAHSTRLGGRITGLDMVQIHLLRDFLLVDAYDLVPPYRVCVGGKARSWFPAHLIAKWLLRFLFNPLLDRALFGADDELPGDAGALKVADAFSTGHFHETVVRHVEPDPITGEPIEEEFLHISGHFYFHFALDVGVLRTHLGHEGAERAVRQVFFAARRCAPWPGRGNEGFTDGYPTALVERGPFAPRSLRDAFLEADGTGHWMCDSDLPARRLLEERRASELAAGDTPQWAVVTPEGDLREIRRFLRASAT